MKEASKVFVKRCEEDFLRRLKSVADAIVKDKSARICTLTGPTCSGKTTAAKLLIQRFAEYGLRAHIVSIDDFYYDTDYLQSLSRQKGLDHIDYDSPQTIDLEALREFVRELLDGTVVHVPIFDFRVGRRTGFRELATGRDDIILFEGIQAAYDEVTSLFSTYPYASICIAPQTPLSTDARVFEPNEIRLLRRIVRDYRHRNTSAEVTLDMWEGVRRNEDAHIFPYITRCAYTIDSTMPYELSMLKPFLAEILGHLAPDSPHYPWAEALLASLASTPALPESFLSADSLYREFI